MKVYGQLEAVFKRYSILDEISSVLHWDAAVMMPLGGADQRKDQLAELALTRHKILTAPELEDLLASVEEEKKLLNQWQIANFERMRRHWLHANAVPPSLVEALSKASSQCEIVWREARRSNRFDTVRPYLEKVICLTKESATIKAETLKCSPYDALLDEYDPGCLEADIAPLLEDLGSFLAAFIPEVVEAQKSLPSPKLLAHSVPIDAQRQLGVFLTRQLGFDFKRGRLDTSVHPFTGGVKEDIRITTRYDEDNFLSGLMATLHETGHAMYEQGLPELWRHQPVGAACGMAIHESQSLIIEMQACRSEAFLQHLAGLIREVFQVEGKEWEAENIIRVFRRVVPSLIRVDADEVTYPAHVIVRFRLERALMSGDLSVFDLPSAWAEEIYRTLGIEVSNDRDGCMQDIHWYNGSFGYFPTYTLGSIAAAQLFNSAQIDRPEILPALGNGNFMPLMSWLAINIQARASLYSSRDLLVCATGQQFNPEVYKTYLRDRYL